MQKSECEYGEAFSVMNYRDTDGNVEQIWNSRDGVTPFIVYSKQGLESQHVNWHSDRFDPCYVPPVGSRVFVDLTRGRAIAMREKYYDRMASDPEYGKDFLERYPDRAAAVKELAEADLASFGPHTPDLVEVTPEMHEQFKERARKTWTPRRFA